MVWKDSLSRFSNSMASKAKDIGGQIKLETEIKTLELKKEKLYKTIGEKFYQSIISGNPMDDCSEYVERLKELDNQISTRSNDIQEIKSKIACPDCGTTLISNSSICPKCGALLFQYKEEDDDLGEGAAEQEDVSIDVHVTVAKVDTEDRSDPTPIANTRICEVCGAELPSNVLFCPECGMRITE